MLVDVLEGVFGERRALVPENVTFKIGLGSLSNCSDLFFALVLDTVEALLQFPPPFLLSEFGDTLRSGLYRPILTQFNAEARRVVQDHARPFCTMKLRTARGFCANLWGSGQTELLAAFRGG